MLRRQGFTLVEMVMVLMIVVLVGMVAIPNWNNFLRSWDVDMETKKLVTKIRDVQQNAMAEQKDYQIVFDSMADTYEVQRQGTVGYDSVEGPDTFEHGIQVSTNIMTPMTDTLRFDKFGAPAQGGGIFLTDSQGANSATVVVTPVTGRIQIQ